MPIFPASVYKRYILNPDINRDAVSEITSHMTKDIQINDPYADFPDQPKKEDYSDFPDQPAQSGGIWNQIWEGGKEAGKIGIQGIGGLARMAIDPFGTAHELAQDITGKTMSLIPFKNNPFIDYNKIGTGGSADISQSIPYRIGAMGEEFLGYNPEEIIKNLSEKNYGKAAGGVIGPTALNWAVGKALHVPGEESPLGPSGPSRPPSGPQGGFSEFGNWVEPTKQPMLPGTEHIDFTQKHPETQLPFNFEEVPSTDQPQQQHLPYGALSWGNVPEPRANAEGQYGLPFAPDVSYEGVPRQSPFQFGPTPTMEDMAPVRPTSEAPPEAPVNPPTGETASDLPGVVFQGDHAIFTAATDANMATMRQRGYGPTGKLQNGWPVWHKVENLSDTPFTRAMRASIARGNPSLPPPEGMPTGGAHTISPTESITVPANVAKTSKLNELAEQGYEIDKVLPNGDVVLSPTGEERGITALSDPFGIGAASELIGKGKDALGRVIENRLEDFQKFREIMPWMGGTPTRQAMTSEPVSEPHGYVLPTGQDRPPGFAPTPNLPGPTQHVSIYDQKFTPNTKFPELNKEYAKNWGNDTYSDPFGIGTVSRALQGLREHFQPAGVNRGGGSQHPNYAADTARIDSAQTPSAIQFLIRRFQDSENSAMNAGSHIDEAHYSDMLNRADQRANEINHNIANNLPTGTRHLGGTPSTGGATIGQRLRAASQPVPTSTTPNTVHLARLDAIRNTTSIHTLEDMIDENISLAESARNAGDHNVATQFDQLAEAARTRRDNLRSFTPRVAPQSSISAQDLVRHHDRINSMDVNNYDQVSNTLLDEFHNSRMSALAQNDRTLANEYRDLYEAVQDRRDQLWQQARNQQYNQRYQTARPMRQINETAELDKVRNTTDIYDAEDLAKEYSGMHETAVQNGDTAAASQLEMMYNESAKKYKELTNAGAARGERPPQEIMDEYMHNPANRKTAKEIQRYERKKNRPMSGVAKQLQGMEGFQDIATTVEESNFNRGINHSYARSQLAQIPNGAPGLELITKKAPKALADNGSYRVIYRNSQGKPIVKADFESQFGVGKIPSFVYDQQAGLSGRTLLKVIKAMAPYGVKMPAGAFSPHTALLMSNLSRLVNTAHGGFIDLGSLFSKNPDNNPALFDYIKTFFSKKNAKGQTIVDIPKLAADLKPSMMTRVGNYLKGVPPRDANGKIITKPSVAREAYNAARGFTTTGDLSAPLRQGAPLIFTKTYWKSFKQMAQALGDEGAFQKSLDDLRARPLFQRRWNAAEGELKHSFAEISGMELMDLHEKLNRREEAVASNWVESGAFLGEDLPWVNRKTGAQELYKTTVGRYTRASNRAYTAFLNQLRADSFESMLKDAYRDFQSGGKGSKDPYTDLKYAREISDAVNTLTGRGPLKLAFPWLKGGRLGEGGTVKLIEPSFERILPLLSDVVYSPKLMSSRVRMLNPFTYAMATPFVRKQYLKGLISVTGFVGVLGALAKGAGADVSLDSNSSDFMKIKVGNTRLDLAGGFQQYIVAASRLLSNHTTSSATGRDFELGQGYRAPTAGSIEQNFFTNKLHPVVKFATDLAFASTHQPFQVGDRTLQLFVPLIVGDMLELVKEDPKLLPMGVPILFGAGSQTYDKGAPTSKFLPKQYDLNLTSGSQVLPWNWGSVNKQ